MIINTSLYPRCDVAELKPSIDQLIRNYILTVYMSIDHDQTYNVTVSQRTQLVVIATTCIHTNVPLMKALTLTALRSAIDQ